MNPDHDTFTPSCSTHAQGLSAYFSLLVGDTIQLFLLLLTATFSVLVLTGSPLLFSALLEKLWAGLLECCDGKQDKLIILSNLDRRSGNDQRRKGLVALDKLLLDVCWHRDKVSLEVLGVLDKEVRVDDRSKGLGSQVTTKSKLVRSAMFRAALLVLTFDAFAR